MCCRWDPEANNIPLGDADKDPEVTYHWYCDNGHKYRSSLLTFYRDPRVVDVECQLCKYDYRVEAEFYTFLKQHYPNIIYQPTYHWLKNNKTGCYRRFDFYIPEHNVIIEADGRQHFIDKEERYNDIRKIRLARKNGLRIIHINKKAGWQAKLLAAITSNMELNWIDGVWHYGGHRATMYRRNK